MSDTNPPQDHTQIACTTCNYNLTGLDLAGQCPECGDLILQTCFWCDYDLTNTDPNTNCPECGVPATTSIGQGVLAPVPAETLTAVHTGMKLATILVLVYIVTVIASVIAMGWAMSTLTNSETYWVVIASSTINNLVLLAITYGWWKISTTLPNIPPLVEATDRRTFLRVMIWVFAAITVVTMLLSFIPTNYDPMAQTTWVDVITLIVGLISLIIMLLFFIAQVRYIGWLAKLVQNKKMEKRAKHLVWSGPLISIFGVFLLFLGPLVILILYWNMIEYTRRDVKKILKSKHTHPIPEPTT